MDPSFIPIETVPSKTPFGLDQLRRSYKTALDAASAIAAAPNVGDADEVFPNMFLMPISTPESAESATRIDLTYQGCFGGAEGSPVLPDQKHEDQDAVQSASSSRGSSGQKLASPITAQFYAPSEVLTWFTFGAEGTKGTVSDPIRDIDIITVVVGDVGFTFDSADIAALVAGFFSQQIVDSIQSTEVVPGQYWLNVERKTKALIPFLAFFPPGFYPQAYAVGTGYMLGDTITVTGAGGACVMTVTNVSGIGGGGILNTTIVSNSFSMVHTVPILATGGSGSGASYTVIQVT